MEAFLFPYTVAAIFLYVSFLKLLELRKILALNRFAMRNITSYALFFLFFFM